MSELLYGRNAVRETLRARRRHVHEIVLADNLARAPIIEEIVQLAKQLNIPIKQLSRHKLDSQLKGHQGVIAKTGRYPLVTVDEILQRSSKQQTSPFILAIDHIEDPHNLGAILRTSEVVGVDGVILPKKRTAQISATTVHVSAGATEHLWIAQVSNLVDSLNKLKQKDVWIAGLEDSAKSTSLYHANLSGSIALVIGSEGKGMSRLVQKTCDFLVKIPMSGHVESLNASVAAGLALYEVTRTRQTILTSSR